MTTRFPLGPRATLALAYLLALAAPTANAGRMLIPMYAYPTTNNALWNAVRDASATVPITAIVNPANGPGASVDSNYATRVAQYNTRGITLAGYVYTGYGARPLAEVFADMDAWRVLYPTVTTLFVDEQSVDLAQLPYYQSIYDHAAVAGFARVFANPGAPTDEAFTSSMSIPVTTVIYESAQNGWITYTTPTYVAGRPADNFSMMVTAVGTAAKMRQAVDLAKSRNVGYVYVTPDKGTNPYDTVPSYWAEEIVRVAAP